MKRRTKLKEISFTPKGGADQHDTDPGGKVLNRSQATTVSSTLKLLSYVREHDDIVSTTMEFHMTIRTKVTNLTPRQASMLLAMACYKAYKQGVDFTLYMALEFLYNRLKKSGQDPLEVKDKRIRETLLVTELILYYIRGNWLNFVDRERLPDDVREAVHNSGWIPSDRTATSWKQHWNLEKYLEVKIVPMEYLIERDKLSSAERYSGYTRGYGNDGSPPAPGKTRPSPELDGVEPAVPEGLHITLAELATYNDILSLIETKRAQRRQKH